MQYNDMSFGQRLKRRLSEKNMTQKQLSNLLGLSETAVSKYFRDASQPDHATLIKIAHILETTVEYLLTGKKIISKQVIDSELADMLEDPKLRVLYEKLMQLNDENLELAVEQLEAIIKRQDKNQKK